MDEPVDISNFRARAHAIAAEKKAKAVNEPPMDYSERDNIWPISASKREICPTPFVWRHPSKIPQRQWLYGKHYISATFAPGGLGKTSLDLVEAVAMATGRPLLGVPVPNQLRVWYWNGEDPAEETERRIAAILLHFKISPEEIEGRLFVDTGRKTPVCIARRQKNEVIFTPDADALKRAIVANEIDVFILDPFVKTHGVPENDNGAVDLVAREFAAIADETNCSVELTHHVCKAGGMGRAEVTVDDGRGAGSLKDAGRAVRVMNVMADEEAKSAQVKPKDRKRYFRVDDDGKANMQAPAESADWFKIISVPLYNDPDDQNAAGDSVGVVVKWALPGVFAGKSFAISILAVYLACFKDWRPYLSPGERAVVLLVAADRDQAKILIRYIGGILSTPVLQTLVVGETADTIELKGHVVIEVATRPYRSVRSRSVCAAILDELGFWRDDDSANPDSAVMEAIRPGMATFDKEAMVIGASSPYARKGLLWDAHQRFYGKEDASNLFWVAPQL
jgi:AAA domain